MGVDRRKRSRGFLTWIQQEQNRDEVLALYYTAKEFGQRPSYYAFGTNVQITSQYEIDFYVNAIGKEHEAELADEAKQRAASGGG